VITVVGRPLDPASRFEIVMNGESNRYGPSDDRLHEILSQITIKYQIGIWNKEFVIQTVY
jgi:hypothetical protein